LLLSLMEYSSTVLCITYTRHQLSTPSLGAFLFRFSITQYTPTVAQTPITMPLPTDVSVDAMTMDSTLCLVFFGEPPTQIRARAWYNSTSRRVVMYDPSKRVKDAYKILLQASLTQLGYRHGAPVFDAGRPLKVTCRFFIEDARKDVDNILKFFMDVMEKSVYNNDRSVYMVVAMKEPNVPDRVFRAEIDIDYANYSYTIE
jgi:Holliday junction resolvase RusA-like endonuclease